MENKSPTIEQAREFLKQRSEKLQIALRRHGSPRENKSQQECIPTERNENGRINNTHGANGIAEAASGAKLMHAGEIIRTGDSKTIDLGWIDLLDENQSILSECLLLHNEHAKISTPRLVLGLRSGVLSLTAEESEGASQIVHLLAAIDVAKEQGSYLVLQHDGNLVQYASCGQIPVWASHTSTSANSDPVLVYKDGTIGILGDKTGVYQSI